MMSADVGRIVLHLDLDDSKAKQKESDFESNLKAKTVSTFLKLDIAEAQRTFDSFLESVKNHPVTASLRMNAPENIPQTDLKFSTSESETAFQNFVTKIQNQAVSTALKLDTAQAMADFQNFMTNIQNQQITKSVRLDANSGTSLKLDINQAETAFQNFVNKIKNQTVSTALKLDTSQAQRTLDTFAQNPKTVRAKLILDMANARTELRQFLQTRTINARLNFNQNIRSQNVRLNLDATSATRKLDAFLNKIRNANPTLRLNFDIRSANTRFRAFVSHVRSTNFNSRLNLNTSDAVRSVTQLTERIRNTNTNLRNSGTQMNSLNGTAGKLADTLKNLFATGMVITWGKACVNAATSTENAFMGLQSIISGQGRDFAGAQAFIQDYVSDGLIPLANAVTAYKNLAARGYDDTQIQRVLIALKDSAAYGRQSAYTMGEAVQTATEGLKNENSILVDNAGVTKNVAKMWQDYAKSIGTTSQQLTQEQKIQAEVNGILEETRFQAGDAAKVSGSFSGQMSRLTASMTSFKVAVGNVLTGVLSPFIAVLTDGIRKMTLFAEAIGKMLGFAGFDANAAVSGNIKTAVSDSENLTDALGTAQDAAEKLGAASFDNFNIIGTDSDSDDENQEQTAVISPSLDMSDINSALDGAGTAISDKIRDFFEPFRNAWAEYGQPFLASFEKAGGKVKAMFADIGRSFAEVWTNGSGERIISNILILLTDIFSIIGDIAGAFSSAWNDKGRGTALIQSYFDSFGNLLDLIHAVNTAFRNVWNDGTGEQIFGNIFEILTNINLIFANLESRFQIAWEKNQAGERIFRGIFGILNDVLTTFNHITAKTAEFAGQIDFSPLLDSIGNVLESLEPFTGHVGEGLEWLWENILLPIAGFTIENIIPDFLNVLSGAIDILDASVEALKPFGEWLWDKFIQPIANWTGDIITAGLENLADVLHDIGDWIRDNPDAALKIGEVTGAFIGLTTLIKGGLLVSAGGKILTFLGTLGKLDVTIGIISAGIVAWGYVITELSKNWDDICDVFEDSGGAFGFISGWIEYLREDIEEFFDFGDFGRIWRESWEKVGADFYDAGEDLKISFQNVVNQFTSGWNEFQELFQAGMDTICDFFQNGSDDSKQFSNALETNISGAAENMSQNFKNLITGFQENFNIGCEAIADTWNGIKENFRIGVGSIAGFFRQLGDNIYQHLADAWQKVKTAFSAGGEMFRGIQDGISGTFQSVVNRLIDGINAIVAEPFRALNDMLGTIRYFEIGGWYPFWELPEISIPEIPRLAKGGLVNQPTLAMIGDNPNAQTDPEIVSPLSKLKSLLPDSETSSAGEIIMKLDELINLLQILIQIADGFDPVLEISDKDIYASAERGKRKFQKMKGVR